MSAEYINDPRDVSRPYSTEFTLGWGEAVTVDRQVALGFVYAEALRGWRFCVTRDRSTLVIPEEWLYREVRKGNQQKEGQFGTILLPLSTTARTIYLGEDGYQIDYQKYEKPLVRATISSASPISIEPCFDPLAAVQVLTNLHRERQYSLK